MTHDSDREDNTRKPERTHAKEVDNDEEEEKNMTN